MAITIGQQLGSYEITALLGKGGMGEVYRARDPKLKRDVAIKILPDEFSRDADRVARFHREAEVLASLNHPNIGAIYDLQHENQTRFLVLELVEGETLAARIQHGPIRVEEALDIAKHICEALEAAHEKGVVHRDLKPANVKVTADGRVKVLDFGLAKAMETTPVAGALSNSPTLTIGATQTGVVLGTAAYMSPEQAKGFEVDARSDTFSFGSVLYEMLTGRQAFQGDTAAEVLASVLVREPDFSLLQPNVNPRIQEALQRCLQKNPKRRWQAVGDLLAELEIIANAPRLVSSLTTTVASPPPWKRSMPAAISAIVFSIIAGITGWFLKPNAPPLQVVRFVMPLSDPNLSSSRPIIALSPDNTKLVYLTVGGQFFLRQLSETEARPLPPSIQGVEPFFSPDGQWIGFFSLQERVLKKVAISGGAAITICKTESAPYGVSWNDAGILFGDVKGIMRVSANGGEPEVLVPIRTDEIASSPQLLDHGRAVLFTVTPSAVFEPVRSDQSEIIAQSLPHGDRKVILRGGDNARYLSSGHLIYSVGGNILAVAFDASRLEMKGGPVPVIEGVSRVTRFAQLSVSDQGGLIYIPGDAGLAPPRSVLALADRSGKLQTLQLPPATYENPRISPVDGKWLAVGTNDGNEQMVSLYDLSGSKSLRRLTFGGNNSVPVWSPDGRYVYFKSDRDRKIGLFRQLADGTAPAERLTEAEPTDTRHFPLSIDPSGKMLMFEVRRGAGDSDIWVLPLEGDRKPRPFLVQPSFQSHAVFSPDGRWLAYMSNELLRFGPQIFVQPYPGTGTKYQVTTEAGGEPLWSPDAKQIFYYWNSRLNAVNVQSGPPFSVGKPSPLPITLITQAIGSPRNYDITPDGKQFIVVLPAAQNQSIQASTLQINVVLNWFTELQQRVPVK